MPRVKKISTEELILLIDNYFVEMRKDITKLKYSKTSKYLKEKGYNIEEYDIRRNHEVVDHINNLRSAEENTVFSNIVAYKNIDVEDFLVKNSNIVKLKKALIIRDNYYAQVCSSANIILDNNKELKERNNKISKKNILLKEENEELKKILEKEKEKTREVSMCVKTLKNILKTNVYPEVANELLRENGLLKGGENIISSEGKEKIISDTDSFFTAIKNNDILKSKNSVIQGLFDKI